MQLKLERKTVNITTLKRFPDNPRFGNVPKIMESIETHGQVRPLLVQKSTRYVLVGNHTLEALIGLGIKRAIIDLVDVDDEQAKKLVLVDNRTSDLASYDEPRLAELLSDLDELTGTAFDEDDLGRLIANVAGDVPKFESDDESSRFPKTVPTCPHCGEQL